ncbi:alpha/beta fold hydrolase [Falsiroseomonas oryziterrae]|uniref:alpha/beta fold hydrolase n=1 Tax=Falsiroseomonas oryziterrae TaxID=2911368 RepID=UPI001F312EB1|nr:alpha/beta fold hydrolase [Roseomonas sp. NPKOSM-4]
MTLSVLHELEAASRRMETPCGDGMMVWRVWNASAGAPIVLLHGGNGSWRHWVKQIPGLAATRCVIVPDLPGLGESALPDEPHEPGHLAHITGAGLLTMLGGTRADLVGFSFGANIAGHLAAERPGAIRSLTLLGAGSLGLARNPVPLEKIRDKQGAERIAAHRFNLNSLMIAEAARIDDLALAIQEWNTVHARFRSRAFANAHLLKDALARTAMPLTALWGGRDQLAVGHIPARIAAVREARPDARAEVIPDAGHWTMYEAPEAFDAALARALAAAG